MTKADLHRLVDELSEGEQETAYRVLKCLRDEKNRIDPFILAMATAPEDDEPFTPEEAAAVQVAEAELARGEGIPADEVWKELLGET